MCVWSIEFKQRENVNVDSTILHNYNINVLETNKSAIKATYESW